MRERDTHTEHEQERGREREGDTEFKAGSRLWAINIDPDAGLKPMNCEIMTRAEVRHLTDWATQVPLKYLTFKSSIRKLTNCKDYSWKKHNCLSYSVINFKTSMIEKSWEKAKGFIWDFEDLGFHHGSSFSLPDEYVFFFFCLLKNFFNIHSFLRDGERVWVGVGAERERQTQNLKQASGSELSTHSPMWGLNPQTARSWPELTSEA